MNNVEQVNNQIKIKKQFKILSAETKQIIQDRLDKMLDDVFNSIYIAQCEQDSPNGPEFWSDNEELLLIANEYIIAVLDGEEG